jgi:hypothetical protein
MIQDDINYNETTEAVIYLKDGTRKYGKLINNDATNDDYYFISNSDISIFLKTKSEKFIEIISRALIEAIDVDLR